MASRAVRRPGPRHHYERSRAWRSHIRLAVVLGHARRIGHGVSIGYEDDSAELLRELAQMQIAVEINLSSNDRILHVSGKDHPIVDYWRAGVPVIISTDDQGVSRSDLTSEYQKATERYDFAYEDLKTIARNSLTFSFLPGKSLWRSMRSLEPVAECANELDSVKPSEPCHRFLEQNERAREQWRLEFEFRKFEQLHLRPY
jgi:adenosine deaminase